MASSSRSRTIILASLLLTLVAAGSAARSLEDLAVSQRNLLSVDSIASAITNSVTSAINNVTAQVTGAFIGNSPSPASKTPPAAPKTDASPPATTSPPTPAKSSNGTTTGTTSAPTTKEAPKNATKLTAPGTGSEVTLSASNCAFSGDAKLTCNVATEAPSCCDVAAKLCAYRTESQHLPAGQVYTCADGLVFGCCKRL